MAVDNFFLEEVVAGLQQESKTLPSKYFYDATGDALFVQIMNLPEYYLTRAEMEIFKEKTQEIIDGLGVTKDIPFEIIELGAGDGSKTIHLLSALLERGLHFKYLPVDISASALANLQCKLTVALPKLSMDTLEGDYFETLSNLNKSTSPKVVLFLGSNLGNMSDDTAVSFISQLSRVLHVGDKILLGLDKIKSPGIVLPAYSDSQGITSSFNLHLLERINEELDADFDVSQFKHRAEYQEEEGIARSFLVSLGKQRVNIKAANLIVEFADGENIATEISRKYTDPILLKILQKSGLSIANKFSDHRNYFTDYLLEKIF